MNKRKDRLVAVVCLLLEIAGLAWMIFSGVIARNEMMGCFMFVWWAPAIAYAVSYIRTIKWGWFDLETHKYGLASAVFGMIVSLFTCSKILAEVWVYLVVSTIMQVALPIVLLGIAGELPALNLNKKVQSIKEIKSSLGTGRLALNLMLSVVVIVIGVLLSCALAGSGVFSNSVIFVWFIPIFPALIVQLVPVVLVVIALGFIWTRGK